MTMPKSNSYETIGDPAKATRMIRWATAFAYAQGSFLLAPWDIYVPTPGTSNFSRYYGNASNFDDMFSFVRTKEVSKLLEDCTLAVAAAPRRQYAIAVGCGGGCAEMNC